MKIAEFIDGKMVYREISDDEARELGYLVDVKPEPTLEDKIDALCEHLGVSIKYIDGTFKAVSTDENL